MSETIGVILISRVVPCPRLADQNQLFEERIVRVRNEEKVINRDEQITLPCPVGRGSCGRVVD